MEVDREKKPREPDILEKIHLMYSRKKHLVDFIAKIISFIG